MTPKMAMLECLNGYKVRPAFEYYSGLNYAYFNDHTNRFEWEPFNNRPAPSVVDFNAYPEWVFFELAKKDEPKPEPKIVNWYRIKIVWRPDEFKPEDYSANHFYRSKNEAIEQCVFETIKVLEWEVKQFPASYDDCV